MSIVHTDPVSSPIGRKRSRRSQLTARDVLSPPVSSTVGRQLSFIKIDQRAPSDDERPSSDSATAKAPKSSSFRRTCNPLPSWLANTFKSLVQNHPLRLLLPPADQLDVNIYPTIVAQEEDPVDDLFAFKPPVSVPNIDKETDFQNSPDSEISLLTKSFVNDANAAYSDTSCSRVSNKLPFSTPGPGLSSSTVVFSPKTCSSPTICTDSHSDPDPRLARPHIVCNFSDSGHFMSDCIPNDYIEIGSLPPDLADASPFSEIYATPGPTYYASRNLHYDSPAEDPLESTIQHHDFGISCDAIDFQWKPFDRNNLIAPNFTKPISFALGPNEMFNSAFSDTFSQGENVIGIQPEQSRSALRGTPLSPAPAVSPSPFRFLPPPESTHNGPTTVVPDFQEHSQKSTISQKPPSAPVPDTSTPTLLIPQIVIPSPRFNLTGRGTNETALRVCPLPPQVQITVEQLPDICTYFQNSTNTTCINTTTLTTASSLITLDADENDDKSTYSQVSTDSIESWGCGTKQDIWEE